jgi:hypothetical protein
MKTTQKGRDMPKAATPLNNFEEILKMQNRQEIDPKMNKT